MEYKPKKCPKLSIKKKLCLINEVNSFSDISLSSEAESDSLLSPLRLVSKKPRRRKLIQSSQERNDYLTRLFEKKKLKDKSLSKKMKTPFDRKLNRTCWPIELEKVSRIKKRPKEKKKGKPNNKSLKKKKPLLKNAKSKFWRLSKITSKENNLVDEKILDEILFCAKTTDCFLHEPVTPQMLIDVLNDPELVRCGATLDMIIAKLRALKLGLNPAVELLKEEVLQKLKCAMKLRLIVEKDGYYRVVGTPASQLSRKKIDAFWHLWYRRFYKSGSGED